MYAVSLTFDRIFDVVRVPETRYVRKQTLFGFQSGTVIQYGVTVPGWPELKAGHTVTVLLRRPDDWQSVQGWVNRSTGELASPSSPSFPALALISLVPLAVSLMQVIESGLRTGTAGERLPVLWCSCNLLMTLGLVAQWLRRRRTVRQLLHLACSSA